LKKEGEKNANFGKLCRDEAIWIFILDHFFLKKRWRMNKKKQSSYRVLFSFEIYTKRE
jgi:hypothetical protein